MKKEINKEIAIKVKTQWLAQAITYVLSINEECVNFDSAYNYYTGKNKKVINEIISNQNNDLAKIKEIIKSLAAEKGINEQNNAVFGRMLEALGKHMGFYFVSGNGLLSVKHTLED